MLPAGQYFFWGAVHPVHVDVEPMLYVPTAQSTAEEEPPAQRLPAGHAAHAVPALFARGVPSGQ